MARSAGFIQGWHITYDRDRPVTGVWRAERFGVGMCAGNQEAIVRMVETKEKWYASCRPGQHGYARVE